MGVIDSLPSARLIVLMLPPFLRKSKLIQWLRILFVPLNYVHDSFMIYIDAQRKILAWRITRVGLETKLNNEFFDAVGSGSHYVTERTVRFNAPLWLDSEGQGGLITGLDADSGTLPQPVMWLDSEIGDGVSLIVSCPASFGTTYAAKIPQIRKLVETYLPAGVKYQIIIQS